MTLTIIIPVYNEKNTLREIISRVRAINLPTKKEIIIIDDGSTDGTGAIIANLPDDIIKIYHNRNMGKGAAIRSGIKHATGDLIIIQDADLEYRVDDYPSLLAPILNEEESVVYGSRRLNRSNTRHSHMLFFWGGALVTWLTNVLYRTNITDEPTCYKLFRSEVLKGIDLKCEGFEFCPEVTAKIAKKNIRIFEVPISYNPRRISEGKKMRAKDGLITAWTLIKYRFKD